MKFLLLSLSIALANVAFGQKWVGSSESHPIQELRSKSTFTKTTVGTDEASIRKHLLETLDNLQKETASIELVHSVESPAGNHWLFQQTLNGVKVMDATIKINTDKSGLRHSLFDRTIDPELAIDQEFPDTTVIRSRLLELYRSDDMDDLAHATVERVYFYNGHSLVPTVRIEVAEEHDHYYEMVLDSDVKVMYQNDLLAYHHAAVDSPVTAFVFMPDPLTSAEVEYGSPYADANDANIAQLDEQRQEVTIEADFGGTFFNLVSPWVIFLEHSPPTNTPAISATPEFDFTRDNDRFEEVNTYYHINTFQQHIQDLGFDNLVNYQISVDVHALNGADNSNFNNAFNPPRLSFGDGGVDDAEDADVIVHEYGHAIMHSAAPGTNSGTERRALDEANGDYFAASYSRHINPFGWERVYSWDGHNEFWNGRMVTSSDHYPEDLVGNIYADADIWSATLMQVWGDLGRDKTDKILLQSAYSYAAGMSMSDAAELFIDAENQLYGGEWEWQIRPHMFYRGLVSWLDVEELETASGIRMINSLGFAAGSSPLTLQFEAPTNATIKVTDVSGRMILTESISFSTNWILTPDQLPTSGLYTISVVSDSTQTNLRVIRLK